MKLLSFHFRVLTLSLAGFVISACATAPNPVISEVPAGGYKLDPNHVSITWSVSHAGLSNYTARFERVSGSLDFDSDTPKDSALDIRIDPASVSTGLPKFDETLAYDSKYFDAKTYPEIRFVSKQIIRASETSGKVTGDLTFRGQTHPVTLDVTYNGAGKSFGHPGKTLGFSAQGILSRSQFGLTYLTNLGIGDDVTLRIEAEFNEAKN